MAETMEPSYGPLSLGSYYTYYIPYMYPLSKGAKGPILGAHASDLRLKGSQKPRQMDLQVGV